MLDIRESAWERKLVKDPNLENPSARHTFDRAAEDRKRIEDRSPDVISSCSQISSKGLPGGGSMLYTAAVGTGTDQWPATG